MAFILPPSLNVNAANMPKHDGLKININTNSMFDIQNCEPAMGKWGNVLVNGGIWSSTAFSGPNNSFKSTLSKFFTLSVLAQCPASTGLTLDTEVSGTGPSRYQALAERFPQLADVDFFDTPRWTFNTNSQIYGDVWWDEVKKYCKLKKDNRKDAELTTPFVDRDGNYVKRLIPSVFELDSISQFSVESVEGKYGEAQVGSKERNMEDMANGRAKSKVFKEMPVVMDSSMSFLVTTAHVGKVFDLDPYNPSMKKYQMQKNDRTVKGVPESFQYNINNHYDIINARPLINQTTKAPEFPETPGDDVRGDTDLMELTVTVLRGKGGGTGYTFPLICSQNSGLLPELSQLYYLKTFKEDSKSPGWGMEGNMQNYALVIYPECKISRTTARQKIDNDPKLRRALQLQCDLLQLHHIDKKSSIFPKERICHIKELYEDLKAMGYDWNDILENTINDWHFIEEEQEKPTLTIYDLLNIRAGLYTPYWKQEDWLKLKRKNMAP